MEVGVVNQYELDNNLKTIYRSSKKEPFFVEVPTMSYLTFDGKGHPCEEDFQSASEALFTLSYIVKFEIARKKLNIDYKVNPMEITWYLDKSNDGITFIWTMMIMQPKFIMKEMIRNAIKIAKDKGKNIAYDRVDFKEIEFGNCIQCFHLGDYNKMNDTLEKMIAIAKENNLCYDQYTHDIYLNNMRKTKIENYKTIMRIKTYKDKS